MKLKMPWEFVGASCWGIDTDFFFPEANTITEENRQAKKICSGCIVKQDCQTYALHYKVSGIWGGTTSKERVNIRKQLNIIAKPITDERRTA